MRRIAVVCLGLGLIITLSGCGRALVGTWRTESIEPPESARNFELATVTFNEDGTFTSAATSKGQSRQDSGTYRFDGFSLKLETRDGKARTYGAMVNSFTHKLEMTTKFEGKKITATLAKEEEEAE